MSERPFGIVIVNFGSHALVEQNFAHLDLHAMNANLVVVDNFSSEAELVAMGEACIRNDWMFEAGANVGFGVGVNRGAARALDEGCDVLVLINPDARATAGDLQELAANARHAPETMVAPTIVGPDGAHWFSGGSVLVGEGRTTTRPGTRSDAPNGWITGACIAVSAELWGRLGGFDDDYFLYWEDVDLSWRCTEAGGALLVRDDVRIVHDVGGTQGAGRAKSDTYYYYNCRNRLLFAAAHLGPAELRSWRRGSLRYARAVLLRGGRRQFLRHPFRPVWAAMRGTAAGLRVSRRSRIRDGLLPAAAIMTLALLCCFVPASAERPATGSSRVADARPAAPLPAPASPSPAATPSPAPTPAPSVPGRPDASNTGVPDGQNLTVHYGDLTVTTAGAVIDSLDIRGFVRVEAPGVTIRNSIIRGRAAESNAILVYAGTPEAAGLLIEDSELFASEPSPAAGGVYGYGFTLRRVDIHSVIDAVHIFGSGVTVEASWLHDNLHYDNDPGWGGGPSHDDSVQIQTGSDIRIVGNSISGAHNAALQITQDQGLTSDVTFSGNWASGGGCTVNVAEKGKGPIRGLSITGNVFGGSTFGCAMIIPPTTEADVSGNTTTDDTDVRIDRREQ